MKKRAILCGLMLLTGCQAEHFAGNTDYAAKSQQESQTQLGVRYLLGRGVPQNNEKAFDYFLAAAKDNDPFAQNEVAYMYAAGKGVEQDYAEAFKYYQKAANHGLASAQYNLGLLYMNGLGVEQNKEQAQIWLQKSAANSFLPAKKALIKYGL